MNLILNFVNYEVGDLCMYLSAISISFSVKGPFMTFVHFSIKFELTLRGQIRNK